MRATGVILVGTMCFAAAGAVRATDCQVLMTCTKAQCIGVPGHFVQAFGEPDNWVGDVNFGNGKAHLFKDMKDVAPAAQSGQLARDILYVVYPDKSGRADDWVDAYALAVQSVDWVANKPIFSKEVSIMVCSVES